MPGGRKTHEFPHGKPMALWFAEISFLAIALVWFFAYRGPFGSLRVTIPFAAALIGVMLVNWKLLDGYERTGEAVPILRRVGTARFPDGMPRPLRLARALFFVVVGAMLVFGLAPIGTAVAETSIVGCVFALIGVAILNLLLERHYVNIGQATVTTRHEYVGPLTFTKATGLAFAVAITALLLWALGHYWPAWLGTTISR